MRGMLILLTILALPACAGKQIKEEPTVAPSVMAEVQVPPVSQKPPALQEPSSALSPPAVQKSIEVSPLRDPGNILSKRNVYFDFDQYEVKPGYRSLVEAHAKYLLAHPQVRITLQGNADDRGSQEYNLALGQNRAVAVKKLMNVFGVPDRQVETISFGEEKPRATGHDEGSWAENRRTDIVYPGD